MTQTWLEVSREAFIHNVDQLKRVLGSLKLGLVVKSNAYGHGLIPMAQLAEQVDDVACLFTSTTGEALQARSAGFTKPIIVMAYYNSPLEEVIKENIDLVCYSYEMLTAVADAARSVGMVAKIHLKIDTGMNRLGITPDEVTSFVHKIAQTKEVKLVGLMSHCADSTNPDSAFTAEQVRKFNRIVTSLKSDGHLLDWIHCCSTGSFLTSRTAPDHTVVRVGSALYGCWKSITQKNIVESLYPDFSLRQILTWKARCIAIKQVAAGSAIGYSSTFYAEDAMTLALIPVGYAEGYPRALSNRGYVLVGGQQCPIIGMVSMGLLAVDVTKIKDAAVGMVVILSGEYTGLRIDDLGQKAGMLNLNVLTGLSASLERELVTSVSSGD